MVYGMLRRLFVESCPACGEASERGFCAVCAGELARVQSPCARCGLARPVKRCPRERYAWSVDAVLAPFAYTAPLDHYVHALKYRGVRLLGRAFAFLLVASVRPLRHELDALVAVPLHRARRCERGYNQAQEIARVLARELRVPALERGIVRRAGVAPQTKLSAGRRRAGIAGAFHVERGFTGLRVAVVDDVVTTGATVNSLAAELRAAGAARCIAIAVARTPEP